MKRRLLAFLLALSMMFSLVPVNAFAVGTAEAGSTASSEVTETEAAEPAAPTEVPETKTAEPAVQMEAGVSGAEEKTAAADTEQEDILSNIGFARAEGSAERVPMDVDYFAATWTFSISRAIETQSFWATFQFDPATTEFYYIMDPGLDVQSDLENGIMRIGGDGGQLYAADYSFEIAFRPKAFGDATVTLKSFEVDGKDYLSAPISVATTVCYSVSWDEYAACTVTGEKLAEAGKDYTFIVAAKEGYDAATMVVKVNGEEVTAVDGKYTVKKTTGIPAGIVHDVQPCAGKRLCGRHR